VSILPTLSRGPARIVLDLIAFAALICPLLAVQQTQDSACLQGTVRDAKGTPVPYASLRLQSTTQPQSLIATADLQGYYAFKDIPNGVYGLRVSLSGYSDTSVAAIFLIPHETKTIDLTLERIESRDSVAADTTPQFFDQPKFTVSGVTDSTSLGGHGSDTVVRTREALAKETAALGVNSGEKSLLPEATEQSLREDAERRPLSFDANHRLGRLLMQEEKWGDAAIYLDRASKTKPDDSANAYDLAFANAQAGQYDRARDELRAILVRHDTAEVHHLFAAIDEKTNDPLDAVREYQRTAEIDPSETYLFDWGSELLVHRAAEPAAQVFAQGMTIFPDSVRMLLGMGAATFAAGSYDHAIEYFCKASELKPNDPTPYIFLGKLVQSVDIRSERAADTLHRFVTLQPQNAEANYYYAIALWKLRKSSPNKQVRTQIETLLKNTIKLDPQLAGAHQQLGIFYSDEGMDSAAISEYQQVIQIDSQTNAAIDHRETILTQKQEAHYRLARAYRRIGQVQQAKEELRQYEESVQESAQNADRERHEIPQFVFTLRDQPSAPAR
jgi:tetratricopeptide (TPR) repeat protein